MGLQVVLSLAFLIVGDKTILGFSTRNASILRRMAYLPWFLLKLNFTNAISVITLFCLVYMFVTIDVIQHLIR